MRSRLPEVAEMGYSYIWIPPPTKSPVSGTIKWSNLGYSLYDRFDIGQYPQRGTWRTRFGLKGELQQLSRDLHACGIGLLPDVVINHNGSGPDYRHYPGMKANDFHVWEDTEHPAGWKRAPRMTHYDDVQEGYGKTFTEELAGLIDIVTEPDDRFITNPPHFSPEPPPFIRHAGRPELYPNSYSNSFLLPKENVRQMLNRWISWLGSEIQFDGLRIDAAKHTVSEFYTDKNNAGFLPSATAAFHALPRNPRRTKPEPLFLAEILSDTDQLAYFQKNIPGMRYLDQPFRLHVLTPAFEEGQLSAITNYVKALPSNQSVRFIQSHDDGGPAKWQAATLTTLTLPGDACIYTSAYNLAPEEHETKTWVRPGRDGAVDSQNIFFKNLLYLHNHFARGNVHFIQVDDNLVIYERYEDLNNNNQVDSGEALLLVVISNKKTLPEQLIESHFSSGLLLQNYLEPDSQSDLLPNGNGHLPSPLIQLNENGLAALAPRTISPRITIKNGNEVANILQWPIPSGRLGSGRSHAVPLITNYQVGVEIELSEGDEKRVKAISVQFQSGEPVTAIEVRTGTWAASIEAKELQEGINTFLLQATLNSVSGAPSFYHRQQKSVYADLEDPELILKMYPTVTSGDGLLHILNPDQTANRVYLKVNDNEPKLMHTHLKGKWFASLSDMPPGEHQVSISAHQEIPGSLDEPRLSSAQTHSITVEPSVDIEINLKENQEITEPFFLIRIAGVQTPGHHHSTLLWNGYPLATWTNSEAQYEHRFDGSYSTDLAGTRGQFFGAFCNGPHYIEYIQEGSSGYKRITRVINFNLFGTGEIDSDGDGLPDDIEFPDFTNGAPGPTAERWPGDINRDMVPDPGENWTHLNPMNHNTTYSGVWDGDLDWDGDGYPNLCEVIMGYREHQNAYAYDIYDRNSHPNVCSSDVLQRNHSIYPVMLNACPDAKAAITFDSHNTVLANSDTVQVGYAVNQWNQPTWTNMLLTRSNVFTCTIPLSEDAHSLHYLFTDPSGTHKVDHNGSPYATAIRPCVVRTNYFQIDGILDAGIEPVNEEGLVLYAMRTNNNLYVATESAHGKTNDMFIFITPFTSTNLISAPWAKGGRIACDLSAYPHLTAESGPSNSYFGLQNGGVFGQAAMGPSNGVLEAEIILDELFEKVPDTIYIIAVAYGDEDGQEPVIQSGSATPDSDITWEEFLPIRQPIHP